MPSLLAGMTCSGQLNVEQRAEYPVVRFAPLFEAHRKEVAVAIIAGQVPPPLPPPPAAAPRRVVVKFKGGVDLPYTKQAAARLRAQPGAKFQELVDAFPGVELEPYFSTVCEQALRNMEKAAPPPGAAPAALTPTSPSSARRAPTRRRRRRGLVRRTEREPRLTLPSMAAVAAAHSATVVEDWPVAQFRNRFSSSPVATLLIMVLAASISQLISGPAT